MSPDLRKRAAKLLAMMGSGFDNEVLSAARLLKSALAGEGLNLNDLAELLVIGVPSSAGHPAPPPHPPQGGGATHHTDAAPYWRAAQGQQPPSMQRRIDATMVSHVEREMHKLSPWEQSNFIAIKRAYEAGGMRDEQRRALCTFYDRVRGYRTGL